MRGKHRINRTLFLQTLAEVENLADNHFWLVTDTDAALGKIELRCATNNFTMTVYSINMTITVAAGEEDARVFKRRSLRFIESVMTNPFSAGD